MEIPDNQSNQGIPDRAIEPISVVSDYVNELALRGPVNTRIHENDEMFGFSVDLSGGDREVSACNYLGIGKEITDSVGQMVKWKFGGFQNVDKLLDFACGYGRVTRFVVQEIEPQRVWVSDISAPAVAFQKSAFGVRGFVSTSDPRKLEVEERFDCIFVASLFTHLPEATFSRWLERLYSLLTPNGLLIVSVHDEALRGGTPSSRPTLWFEERSEIDTLDKNEYGSTVVNESYMREAVERATGLKGNYFRIPKGLNHHQDFYMIVGESHPDFSTFHFSVGPQGYLESCTLPEPDLLQVSGWAADLSGSRISEVRVSVQGQLVQRCVPFGRRPDVAAYFKSPIANLSGYSCVGRLPSDGSLLGAALLTVAVVSSDGVSRIIYHNRFENALKERSG